MILFIDSSDGQTIFVAFADRQGKLKIQKRLAARYRQAARLLPAIESLRKKLRQPIAAVTGIIVVSGPGPFTALRVGVITANTLAWALNVPIVAIKASEPADATASIERGLARLNTAHRAAIIEPYYGQAPNITIKKV